jgi:nucleoid-associated protein YgaU
MLTKATITNIDTGKAVECMFNPKEYTFSKQNSWEQKTAKGQSVAHLEFGGGNPASLKMQLLFDTYEDHPPKIRAGDDVRTYTAGLWDMMKISERRKNPDTGKSEPPHCRFEWGDFWSFEAVIESLSQKFTLFDRTGKPLRAILDVSFKQVRDEGQYPRQNPTSGGIAGERLRTIYEGETLSGIAYEEYGDPTIWRHLADTNPWIADPLHLPPGHMVLITPLPDR